MATSGKSGDTGETRHGSTTNAAGGDDLDRRKRDLEAALAERRPSRPADGDAAKVGGNAGFGQAMRLSSEFIAGILVGVGIGWIIDRVADTSPFGLIVFLMLGFGAGVLNLLRAAGMVAERRTPNGGDRGKRQD